MPEILKVSKEKVSKERQTIVIKIPQEKESALNTTEPSQKEFLLINGTEAISTKYKVAISKRGESPLTIPTIFSPYITHGKIFKECGKFYKLRTAPGCDQHPDTITEEFISPIKTAPAYLMGILVLEIIGFK